MQPASAMTTYPELVEPVADVPERPDADEPQGNKLDDLALLEELEAELEALRHALDRVDEGGGGGAG